MQQSSTAETQSGRTLQHANPGDNRPLNAAHSTHEANIGSVIPSAISLQYPTGEAAIPVLENITIPNPQLNSEGIPEDEIKVKQSEDVVIPSFAAWFSLDHVHDIEIRAFSDFFPSGDSNPPGNSSLKSREIYIEQRNFIVNLYRRNPRQYVTITACRRHLSCDVTSIMRIHSFLEQWGLINYQVDQSQQKPQPLIPADTRHFKIFAKTPNRTVLHAPSISVKSEIDQSINKEMLGKMDENMEQNINIATCTQEPDEYENVGLFKESQLFHCSTCGILCKSEYYHCLRAPSVNICKPCFLEGRFANTFYSADFVHIEANAGIQAASKWTDQECLYLLEAIEMYGGDDWDAIAKHVGGLKSREECISKFLQLPILENISISTPSSTTDSTPSNPMLLGDNPIMSLVSFLATMIHPNVAAAAAKAAIDAYEQIACKQDLEKNISDSGGQSLSFNLNKETTDKISQLVLQDASLRASELCSNEDDKLRQYMSIIVEAHIKKMELKMLQIDSLEEFLRNERIELEKQRKFVVDHKLQLFKNIEELRGAKATNSIKSDQLESVLDNPDGVESSLLDAIKSTNQNDLSHPDVSNINLSPSLNPPQ